MGWENFTDTDLLEENDYVQDFMDLTDKEVVERARRESDKDTHPTTLGIIKFYDERGLISHKQKLVLCRFLAFKK